MPFGGSVRFAVTAASIQVFPRPWDAAGSFRAQEKDALGGCVLVYKMLFYP